MKKILLFTLFGLLSITSPFVFSACKDDEPITELKGTTWKLAGFVDATTDVLTAPQPQNCKECYTLTFDTEHTATAHSISIDVKLDLWNLNPNRNIADIYIDEGHSHGQDFRIAILIAEAFSIIDDELKLFYHDRASYLLFKLH
jgi:hypothetical protein